MLPLTGNISREYLWGKDPVLEVGREFKYARRDIGHLRAHCQLSMGFLER